MIFIHFKKHWCLKCSAPLKPEKVSKIVNSFSPEAKEHDFSAFGGEGGFAVGNIKFVWYEFKCPECEFQIAVKDLKKAEEKIKDEKVSQRSAKSQYKYYILRLLFPLITALLVVPLLVVAIMVMYNLWTSSHSNDFFKFISTLVCVFIAMIMMTLIHASVRIIKKIRRIKRHGT